MKLDLEAMKAAARECPDMLSAHIVVDMPLLEKLRTFHQTASPTAVLALIERLEQTERNRDMWKGQCERQAQALRKQAASAKMGMDAAKANGAAMERSAKAMLAQSNPDALESERQANALLTEENERLQREIDAARAQLLMLPRWAKNHITTESANYDCWKCHNALVAKGIFPTPRMIVCPTCGNKRCPKASDHDLACTGSNEPGQPGSVYY